MTFNLFINSLYILLAFVIILFTIPLIGIIVHTFDFIIMKRKSKKISKQLSLIEAKATEVIKDFNNCSVFTGLSKTEEIALLEKELQKLVDEELKDKKKKTTI